MANTAATAAKTAPAAPALDFANLTAETVTDMPKAARRTKVEGTPFLAWVKETHETGTGRAVTVPAANVGEVVYLIRAAAQAHGLGAKIVKSEPDKSGNVRIVFAGKARRAYTRKPKDA